MRDNTLILDRRGFLIALGVAAGAGALGVATSGRANAETLASNDWRRLVAEQYLDYGALSSVLPLQDGIEVWEGAHGGYMVVESAHREILEGSATAPSPYHGVAGESLYLGPGEYYTLTDDKAVGLANGEVMPARELRAMSRDATSSMQELLVPTTSITDDRIGLLSSGGGLPPVKAGDVKSRVKNYGYITGSTLYPNTAGICGWVAGSIITRYWHARSSARKLLPTKFRNGTNMTKSPNFATHLQNGKANGTWARTLKDQLIWNAKNQSVAHSSSWALGNLGMWNELRAGYPFILFGSIPINKDKKKGGHAVVAYGETTGGQLITHYGWSGYTNIVLNAGLVGSNTKFRLV